MVRPSGRASRAIMLAVCLAGCGSTDRIESKELPLQAPEECRAASADLRRCLEATSNDSALIQRRVDSLEARLMGTRPTNEMQRESMRQQCIAMAQDLKKQCL
jgi:hypothetical protein